ncbi:MAG: hypothetical protein C6Y22_07735 [Hapalosiphonaceae cyanobacterium JJU2]|nr:MAG: hypothetical protein C6Y22_07735 [Hapalosiphonaceae cyanobacterium JJU2]
MRYKLKRNTYTFYNTGIKLLIRKDVLKEYRNNNRLDVDALKTKIKIGAVIPTTTFDQLYKHKYERMETFGKSKDAVDELNNSQIDALASEPMILRSLINKLQEPQKFEIYPESSYLPNMNNQEYFIAISNYGPTERYSQTLLYAVNKVLSQSPLKDIEIDKLRNNENGNQSNNPKPTPTPTPTPPPPPPPSPLEKIIKWFLFIFIVFIVLINFPIFNRFMSPIGTRIAQLVGRITGRDR